MSTDPLCHRTLWCHDMLRRSRKWEDENAEEEGGVSAGDVDPAAVEWFGTSRGLMLAAGGVSLLHIHTSTFTLICVSSPTLCFIASCRLLLLPSRSSPLPPLPSLLLLVPPQHARRRLPRPHAATSTFTTLSVDSATGKHKLADGPAPPGRGGGVLNDKPHKETLPWPDTLHCVNTTSHIHLSFDRLPQAGTQRLNESH